MIDRYSRPEMARVWSDARRLEIWLEVECAVLEVREQRAEIERGTCARIRKNARLDAARMTAIEREVHHDVIAFLSMLAESIGDDARHVHSGLTSSDLVDTALAVQTADAGRILLASLAAARRAAWDLAQRHRHTPEVGRTHGVHAEPITFGLKCLSWSEELGRGIARLRSALEGVAVGKFSGAVGTLAHLAADVEVQALARLALRAEPVATQVVARDRHAALLATVAVAAGTLERIALEIRHLQRTEVREAAEPFRERQKGSSAMPHKRNPVRSERVCGLARLVRANAHAAFENQALWHERDISHSSVERVILPDSFLAADFMAAEMASVLGDLQVDPARMLSQLESGGGLVFSQRVLLALTQAGMARDEAYAIVQEHALAAADGRGEFRAELEADPRILALLSLQQIAGCFTLEPALRHVDALFSRASAPEE